MCVAVGWFMPSWTSTGLALSLAALVAIGCSGAPADEASETGADAVAAYDAPPRPVTHFPSGDVDLTAYTSAGDREWRSFRAFYEARHVRADQPDTWPALESRTTDLLREIESPAESTGTVASYMALKGFTAETKWFSVATPPIEQDYRTMNTALRAVAGDATSPDARAALTRVEGYVKSATSALNTLSPVSVTVHRRIFFSGCDTKCEDAFLAKYPVGKFVQEASFLSTSEREKVTCLFRGQFHYVIATNGRARSIAALSAYPDEAEVLFPPGVVFKVDRTEKRAVECEGSSAKWQFGKPEAAPATETVIFMSAR